MEFLFLTSFFSMNPNIETEHFKSYRCSKTLYLRISSSFVLTKTKVLTFDPVFLELRNLLRGDPFLKSNLKLKPPQRFH